VKKQASSSSSSSSGSKLQNWNLQKTTKRSADDLSIYLFTTLNIFNERVRVRDRYGIIIIVVVVTMDLYFA